MHVRTSIASLLAAAALVAAGCGGDDEAEPANAGAGGGAETTDSLEKGIVYVEGIFPDKDPTKVTGVVFETERGLVLTANHATENAPNINVTLPDGTVAHGERAARLQCHDLAVLRLRPKPAELTAVPLADSAGAAIGQPVRTLAYQATEGGGRTPPLSQIQGRIFGTNVFVTFNPLPQAGPFIAHQTSLSPGAAGSPLLDAQGRMIGINTLVAHARTPAEPGIEYALTSNYVKQRLRQLKPGKGGALGGWGADHDACHAALLKLIGAGHTGATHK
jgi:S1-C subfamily serine protease